MQPKRNSWMNKAKAAKRACKLVLKNIYESTVYFFTRSTNVITRPKKIVFVCKGNICRSAFAECLMREGKKDTLLTIDSCGLNVDVGTPSPPEAITTAKKFGLNMESHFSKGLAWCDLENADLILAMEFRQFRRLVEIFPHKKESIKLLREFAPFPENLLCNINDPFGQSEKKYEKCFRQIKRSILTITARM